MTHSDDKSNNVVCFDTHRTRASDSRVAGQFTRWAEGEESAPVTLCTDATLELLNAEIVPAADTFALEAAGEDQYDIEERLQQQDRDRMYEEYEKTFGPDIAAQLIEQHYTPMNEAAPDAALQRAAYPEKTSPDPDGFDPV